MKDKRPGDELLAYPIEWGRRLILTNDHDPLYTGLVQWNVRESRVRRFMLAYWCCYSVGASWYISDKAGASFWELLLQAAKNVDEAPIGGRWPRAHERRHWRGEKCVESVRWLSMHFRHPEEAVISLEGARSLGAVNRLMNWPQFGPWIAFKAADMLERVLGVPVAFPKDIVTLYKDPREGAEMVADIWCGPGGNYSQEVVLALLLAYSNIIAPGQRKTIRCCNIQEVETVLCKWKSARKGNYWIGLDTRDHRAELSKWGAHDLLEGYPSLPT